MAVIGFTVFEDKILDGSKRQTIRKLRKHWSILAVLVIAIVSLSLFVQWNPEANQYQFSLERQTFSCEIYKFHQYAQPMNIELHDGQRVAFIDSDDFFKTAHAIYVGNVTFPVGAEVVGLNMAERFEPGSWAHGLYTLDMTGQEVFLLQCS